MTTHRYWPALDGLRGIAILLVIPHNMNAFHGERPIELLPAVVSHVGWIGVQIFFVLSGFLITSQLREALGTKNYFSSFYMRRALRILPLYYLSLMIVLLILPQLLQLPAKALATHNQQVWLWLFLNNWTQPFHGAVYAFPHFWSLAVEEQFYLLWPMIVLWCRTGQRLLYICAATIAAALLARAITLPLDLPPDVSYMFTICRMDALAIGAGAAVLAREHADMQRGGKHTNTIWWVVILGMTIVALMTRIFDLHSPVTVLFGYPLLALVTAGLILETLEPRSRTMPDLARALLCLPALRSVGRYSYAMYVVHMPLMLLGGTFIRNGLQQLGLDSAFWYVGTFTLLTYLAGMCSYYLFERHFLSLKRHFEPRT